MKKRNITDFDYEYNGWWNIKKGYARMRIIYETGKPVIFVCEQKLNNETTSIINNIETITDYFTTISNPFEEDKSRLEKLIDDMRSDKSISEKLQIASDVLSDNGKSANILRFLSLIFEVIERKLDCDFKKQLKRSHWVLIYPGRLLGPNENDRYFYFQYDEKKSFIGKDIHDFRENILKNLSLEVKDLEFSEADLM